jgi:osmotically-inducible protein OsmY
VPLITMTSDMRSLAKETPESVRMVDNLSDERSVCLALRRDERIQTTDFTVHRDGGAAMLTGVVDTQDEAIAAAELAAGLESVVRVDNQLKAASSTGSRFRREG